MEHWQRVPKCETVPLFASDCPSCTFRKSSKQILKIQVQSKFETIKTEILRNDSLMEWLDWNDSLIEWLDWHDSLIAALRRSFQFFKPLLLCFFKLWFRVKFRGFLAGFFGAMIGAVRWKGMTGSYVGPFYQCLTFDSLSSQTYVVPR